MYRAWFVTGTDTEIGKTHACCALLHALRLRGFQAVGMKPVAAGTDANGHNDDVERLLAASTVLVTRGEVNPYLFERPIAPHVAAADAGVHIDLDTILTAYRQLATRAEAVVVEGVGGFCVPLDDQADTGDLAVALNLPVILVVGLRLGCINHALLTAEAIAARGLSLAGWIANCIDPAMEQPQATISTLSRRLRAPLLGTLPHGQPPEIIARHLAVPR